MPIIPAPLRQEDCEFKASLGNIVRFHFKNKNKQIKQKQRLCYNLPKLNDNY
jgi:hypothetical protein